MAVLIPASRPLVRYQPRCSARTVYHRPCTDGCLHQRRYHRIYRQNYILLFLMDVTAKPIQKTFYPGGYVWQARHLVISISTMWSRMNIPNIPPEIAIGLIPRTDGPATQPWNKPTAEPDACLPKYGAKPLNVVSGMPTCSYATVKSYKSTITYL